MVRRLVCGVVGLVVAATFTAVGCGSRQGFDEPAAGTFAEGGADTGTFDPTKVPGACTGPRCSSDLRTQVDFEGNVLKTCPPDQGCGPGGNCVPACQAATDSKGSI